MMTMTMTPQEIETFLAIVQADAEKALGDRFIDKTYSCLATATFSVLTDNGQKDIQTFYDDPTPIQFNTIEVTDVEVYYYHHIGFKTQKVFLGRLTIQLPYEFETQNWPVDTLNGAPFCAEGMSFSTAMAWAARGRSVCLLHFPTGHQVVEYKGELVLWYFSKKELVIKPYRPTEHELHSKEWEIYDC